MRHVLSFLSILVNLIDSFYKYQIWRKLNIYELKLIILLKIIKNCLFEVDISFHIYLKYVWLVNRNSNFELEFFEIECTYIYISLYNNFFFQNKFIWKVLYHSKKEVKKYLFLFILFQKSAFQLWCIETFLLIFFKSNSIYWIICKMHSIHKIN